MALWGSEWGEEWGGVVDPPPAGPGATAADGPDIVFYGESETANFAELAVDHSGYGVDFDDGAGWIYADPFDRVDPSLGYSVEVVCAFANTIDGYLYAHDDVSIKKDGTTMRVVTGSVTHEHAIENVGGPRHVYLVTWSMEPNAWSTGPSDAMRSELWIYDYNRDGWEHSTWLHDVPDASPTEPAIFGASDTSGTDAFEDDITHVRIGRAFHTSTENNAVFVAEPAEPTLQGDARIEWPVPTLDSAIGNDGEMAGPIYTMATRHVHSQDLRLHSPLVNEICTGAIWSDSEWVLTDPVHLDTRFHLESLRRRPLPPACNRVHVRAFVLRSTAAEVYLRAFSANGPGHLVTPAPTPSGGYTRFSSQRVQATAGQGWVDLGQLRVEPDAEGYCYFWLGLLNEGTGNYRVLAWSVDPVLNTNPTTLGGGGVGGVGG